MFILAAPFFPHPKQIALSAQNILLEQEVIKWALHISLFTVKLNLERVGGWQGNRLDAPPIQHQPVKLLGNLQAA